MSKEQINYLLALATLTVVWLYFNTLSGNTNKNCGPGPRGGMMSGPGRYPAPMGRQNMPQPPNMTEFLKNQGPRMQTSDIPGATLFPPSEGPQKDAGSKS
jgi:hypothetical protein